MGQTSLRKKRTTVFIVILTLLCLVFSSSLSCNFEPAYEVTENVDSYSVHSEWMYKSAVWKYDLEFAKAVYNDYSSKDRPEQHEEYVVDTDDDALMGDLATLFKDDSEERDWDEYETVEYILAFVQSIPYVLDEDIGYEEYPYYPVETLVNGSGDCEDTAILFSSIARELDYGVVILLFAEDEHKASGIEISQDFIDNWQHDYPLTYYTANSGNKYAYCETTATGYGIGQKPTTMTGNPQIIDVSKD